MSYSAGHGLPFEHASKLGHLNVIQSEWIKSLISDFETNVNEDPGQYDNSIWNDIKIDDIKPLQHIWAVDGSYAEVSDNKKEVAFVKTALMTIEQNKISSIDRDYPHPLLLQEIMTDSALFHATVFPLKNIRSEKGNLYDTVRNVIYDSMRIDEEGEYFETLKWLSYKKWTDEKPNSPNFQCPHCQKEVKEGLPFDSDKARCPFCGNDVYLTDMLGFHLDMNEENAPLTVASSYMKVMELLMLFTVIRIHWNNVDRSLISETLYIKDGPLSLRGQYVKLVPLIREFLQHAFDGGRPIHILGCEKSGTFFDYLERVGRYVSNNNGLPKIAVLNHGFIRDEINRTHKQAYAYGFRTNWGEKALVVLDRNTQFVLNMTTGNYYPDDGFPQQKDMIGLDRIIATLPSLVSRRYAGALYPIELVNGIASMSYYPSSRILKNFVDAMISQ